MSELEKLQNKPRHKRTPLESCVVDAAIFEEAEHDGEIEIMEQAARDLARLRAIEAAFWKIVAPDGFMQEGVHQYCPECGQETEHAESCALAAALQKGE
jgi:hypothetical protein